jgi:hypothetical protein
VPVRRFALAQLISPAISVCAESFRDAYARTGMNLMQSIALLIVVAAQRGWRALASNTRRV